MDIPAEIRTDDSRRYSSSAAELESLEIFESLQEYFDGDPPIQIGICSGAKYRRSSEFNIAQMDAVLLLEKLPGMTRRPYSYDTSNIAAFLLPAETAGEDKKSTLESCFREAPMSRSLRKEITREGKTAVCQNK